MVHLFEVMYAREIEACGGSPTRTVRETAQGAGIPKSCGTGINTGRLVAEYATPGDRSILRWCA